MGWYYPYGANRKSLIAELTQTQEDNNSKRVCLASCFRGAVTHKGTLWSVWERTIKATGKVVRYITCDLLEYVKGHGIDGWGYKPLDESSFPYQFNCPMKYLEMVPEVQCQEWRDLVIQHHAERKAKREAKNS